MNPIQLQKEATTNILNLGDPLYAAFEQYKEVFQDSLLLIESQNSGEILRNLVILLRDVVRFSGLGVLLQEQIGGGYYLFYEHRLNEELFNKLRWLERSGYIEWTGKEGRITVIPNDELDTEELSVVLVPLKSGKRSLGVIAIFLDLNSETITHWEMDILSLIGNQAGVALRNAFLYQDLATKNHALQSMKNFLEYSLESMTDGLIAVDEQEKVSLFNANAGKLLGYEPSYALGLRLEKLLPGKIYEFLKQALVITYTTGGFEGECEYQNLQNQRSYPLGFRLSVLRNSEKETIGAVIICRDLSEQKELIHLKKLDQLKDEFISAVSHELRTPLTSIKSFTEILLQFKGQDLELQ